jgi:hypothetical protein
MKVAPRGNCRVAALLLVGGLICCSYLPLTACVTKQLKPDTQRPVVIFNLRHNFPSGQPGPKGIDYAIHIFSGGLIKVFDRDVTRIERTVTQEKIYALLELFRHEKIGQLSDGKIMDGVFREYRRRTGHEPGVLSVGTHREDWSELIIQHPALGTNKFLWYGLKNWLSHNPGVKELEALNACIGKIYELAEERRE